MRKGGAEQVALALHKTFPDAPIYTLCYNPATTYPEFKKAKVITSLFQKIVKSETQMKLLFYPLGFWAMRLLKVEGYDKVILSSTYASRYAKICKGTIIINYCHNPFRLAWYPESYDLFNNSNGFKKLLLNFVIKKLREIDYRFTRKCHKTIVNSKLVKSRVSEIYGIEPNFIINPPVNTENFAPSNNKKNYYLLVSRLENYKRVDLAIEAFNCCNKRLLIIGNGSQKQELMKRRVNENIIFRSNLSKEELRKSYSEAKALIFPQLEDFGITPLEANASGTPVIAFGKGGVLETIIPYPSSDATGFFFKEQTKESLIEAINKFEKIHDKFNTTSLVKNAKRFSLENFSTQIRRAINA